VTSPDQKDVDVAIIGGGIVGVATAYELTRRRPGTRVAILEKEDALARHQSGRNSGVIHSGIYYRPGSLKARLCRDGSRALRELCEREGIPFAKRGKVIVAVDESEVPALERLAERGTANGVAHELIDGERLRALEPHAAGVRALHVPDAGVVDFAEVCLRLAERACENGATVETGARVITIEETADRVRLRTSAGGFSARFAINCAGLHADRVARLAGLRPSVRLIPFRGEYWELTGQARELCRSAIYPVPDPRLPFLGVHFTRRVDDVVECGPNAVLAFSREGYRRRDVSVRDLAETLGHRGFRRLARRHYRHGLSEWRRSLSRGAFLRTMQRLVPDARGDQLAPAPAGVRAQAVDGDGALIDDFVIEDSRRMVHVVSAPSPAATACLAIAGEILGRVERSSRAPSNRGGRR
jgi:L-2-hydroxyglutarate oxidase LhgO